MLNQLMSDQIDPIYANDAIEAILKLVDIQNPEKTLVVMTDSMYQELRSSASKKPEDSYMTPDGKPSKNLLSEIIICQTYKIRTMQVFLKGRCLWIVLALTLGSLRDRKNFSTQNPESAVIVIKR